MKPKIAIFSALLCVFGVTAASASDYLWDDGYIDEMPVAQKTQLQKPAPLPTNRIVAVDETYYQPVYEPIREEPFVLQAKPLTAQLQFPSGYEYAYTPDYENVKGMSIKKSVPDDRAPVWDGVHGEYKQRAMDKTVDWRDGVPIWDDSVSHYRDKDYRDWFLEPARIEYFGEMPLPVQDEVTVIRKQIEDLLIPLKPRDSLWTNDKYQPQDMTVAITETFGAVPQPVLTMPESMERADGCPFETDAECTIWRRKPMVRETVAPRSAKIRATNMDAFVDAACANPDITANTAVAAPLAERYRMLMQSARACCTDGMAYQLKQAGASDGLVYKFLSDDANFYQFGARCLMMSDNEFDTKYPNTATAAVAADVRNGCLCRGRQWFTAMLAPFAQAYQASPEFAKSKFNYTYLDGLQRETTVSVNTDVQNVLNQLALCP